LALKEDQGVRYSIDAGDDMKSSKHCAYNQTRECFLGLEISAPEIPFANLKDLLGTLTLQSGEGLWLNPHRGFPAMLTHRSLDVIYLDEECRVIEVAESLTYFRATASSLRAASVLALPAHTIYSSQTRLGDQLVICMSDEMEVRLNGLSSPKRLEVVLPSNDKPVETAIMDSTADLLSQSSYVLDDTADLQVACKQECFPKTEASPRSLKQRLKRWLTPDARKAPRKSFPNLVAYFWTGGIPEPHPIRDISATGFYLLTTKRWFLDTLVLMTLQISGEKEARSRHAISLRSRVVRLDSHGVGLQFALLSREQASRQIDLLNSGAHREELEKFLHRLGNDKGQSPLE
jgi:hypothetical protein